MEEIVKAGWLAGLVVVAACGGRLSEPDAGSPVVQGSGGRDGVPSGRPPPDAAFEICPQEPPRIGVSCDLAPHSGCAYLGFGGQCESFVCVNQVWQSANGDGC